MICTPTSSTPFPLGKLRIELLLTVAAVSPAAVVGVPSMCSDTPSCLDVAGSVVLWNVFVETLACENVPEALRTMTPPPYGLVTLLPVTVSWPSTLFAPRVLNANAASSSSTRESPTPLSALFV